MNCADVPSYMFNVISIGLVSNVEDLLSLTALSGSDCLYILHRASLPVSVLL